MASHHVSLEDKFQRFLYLSSPSCLFISGNPEGHFTDHKNEIVVEMVKNHTTQFAQILTKTNEDKLLTKRQNLLYALALVLTHPNVHMSTKMNVKDLVLKVCKNDEEFFTFIKYHTQLSANKHKISKRLKNIIKKFYDEKSAEELAESVRLAISYHGWRHKDLIKLCHIKTKCPLKKVVLEYILFGFKKIQDLKDENVQEIINHLKKTHEFRTTDDVLKAAVLIDEFKVIPPLNERLAKKEELWNSIIPKLTIAEILRSLTKFYKLGLLKPGTSTHGKVIEALTNSKKIEESHIHPVDVFIYLKKFEKGGKPLDPKLIEYLKKKDLKPETYKKITTPNEPKCQTIINNINKCLVLAYNNVQSTGKKFMITIDVTNKNDIYCMHNKNISTLEAVYALTRCILKIEKNSTVAVFDNEKINLIDLTKSYSIPKFVQKLHETQSSYITPNAPFEWAVNKKKVIDVFISFMECDYQNHIPKETKTKLESPSESLHKYCKKMKNPDTKYVRIFLGGLAKPLPEHNQNILDICGFSEDVPRILEAFVRGKFT